MKKIAIILSLFIALLLPVRAAAQGASWIALQSDSASLNAPGQIVNMSLAASLDTPINGASFILRYDPTCFKVAGHQPGSLLTGSTDFVQEQPGQFDLTYYFQGQGKGLTGEGSLINLQLETLQLCSSDISIAPETITLGVLDTQGLAFNLPNVEYRSLSVHFAPADGQPAAATQPGGVPPANVPSSSVSIPVLTPEMFWLFMSVAAILFVGLVLFLALFFLLRPRSARRAPQKGTSNAGPALMHAGGVVPLPRQRTRLGRHIEIVHQNGEFYLMDTGSRLGAFLNGNRLGAGLYPLRDGDRVQLGNEMTYRFINASKGNSQYR
jgi:hypothetical protein